MARRKISSDKVVYLAPETLGQEELAEKLAATDDPQEIAEILNSRPTTGEYREYLGDQLVDGPEGTTVLAAEYGDLVVWVNTSPDDREDPSGYFERFDGDIEDYTPRRDA